MSGSGISLEAALEMCLPYAESVDTEIVPVEYANQRVLCGDIFAAVDIPVFSHSRVDGFAIHEMDVFKLQQGEKMELEIVGTLGAGSANEMKIKAGQSIEIMTGAMLPLGVAAIAKKEDVTERQNKVIIEQYLKRGDGIQAAASQFRQGDLLAANSQVLDVYVLEKLASCGTAFVNVFKIPAVYVINTGSELVLPGKKLNKGQIYVSNKTLYYNKIISYGGCPLGAESPVADEITAITEQLKSGVELADLVIISGGTAEGQFDLVNAAFHKMGAEIIFAGLDMRPGHYVSTAIKEGVLLFNLPGNPGAGNILFEVMINPVLRKIKGIKFYQNQWFDLTVKNLEQLKTACRMMVRGCAEIKNGQFTAWITSKNEMMPKGLLNLIIDINYPDSNTVKAFITD